MNVGSSDERQPLLHAHPSNGMALPEGFVQAKESSPYHPGPSEITRTTRTGILAGIWMAMFLACYHPYRPSITVQTRQVGWARRKTLIPTEFVLALKSLILGSSFLLATCTFTPLYGRLCDALGRRGANQAAVVFAAVGTLACGLSNSLEMLIAARFLSGMGGGGIFTTASIITSDMYSMRERSITQGIAAIFNGAGMGLGGPFGGWISDHYGWRWAFLIQIPFFALSFFLTTTNLNYVIPGKGQCTKEIFKRIDYGGCISMFTSVGGLLFFLSFKYNQEYAWDSAPVVTSLVIMIIATVAFVFIELKLAPEPMLAPFLLCQTVPVVVGCSIALVSMCNFSTMYFLPIWFETVQLQSASVAGLSASTYLRLQWSIDVAMPGAHLLPHSVSISLGSFFAGWYIARTGRYKNLEDSFGLFPFVATLLIYCLREDSSEFEQWFSIIPMGFGNSVILQTTLNSVLAVGTGFTELFRGVGQILGVAVSSAFFQSILDRELRARIKGENADEYVLRIRHSTKLVAHLEPHIQRAARDSYAITLKAVFLYAAACSLISFLIRLRLPELSLDQPEETSGPSTRAATIGSNENTIEEDEDEVAHLRPTPHLSETPV
ncbi:MFS transporter [Ceratobasidium theobromae]|uniref:MFS transporter n=1 Tax=Ceratobasidium theobromae TaxID=1582974 RepID=A0A5N5QTF1_9AGAM|nr:MFS transporter [Ceratobasidium theobromae]